VFNACKKNNYGYIDKNKDRLGLSALCSHDARGNTPLYMAVANRHIDTARFLLDKGVPINIKNENGNTVLHKAFMNQDYDMIGFLQMKGADIKSMNELGQTPLYFASKKLLDKLGIRNMPTNFVGKNDPLQQRTQTLIRVKHTYMYINI
jgi:ankyrin repeat protein